MATVVYIENAVRGHPRVQRVCARLVKPEIVWCERYTEVFNPRAQNFRIQKRNPALILARKHDGFVMDAPAAYAVGGDENFYFSHMLNCIYDCRYCFLQGMFRSAHYVLFVNYEEFTAAMAAALSETGKNRDVWFFSGHDCDSLAYEPVTRFAAHFVPFFESHPNAFLELRTKSNQIRSLLGREPLSNVIVAFSFTPQPVSDALEHKVPGVDARLRAMVRLQEAGWQVGLRFDPLIYYEGYKGDYAEMFNSIFTKLDPDRIHSVSLGSFRLPWDYHRNITRLYPEEPLFTSPMEVGDGGLAAYPPAIKDQMLDYASGLLLQWVSPQRLFNHERDLSERFVS